MAVKNASNKSSTWPAGDKEEPLLGVTVLESVGFCVDPQREQLIPRPPKRKPRR